MEALEQLAFMVMNIGYVQNNILNLEAFYTLMFTAFFLNISVPVSITLWKPYYKGEKKLFLRSLSRNHWIRCKTT